MGGMGGMGGMPQADSRPPREKYASELAQMQAIIIPGAATAVYDVERTPWLPVITRLIQNVYENH